MRRVGCNPTDVEVRDIIHRIDDDTGGLDFQVGIEQDTSKYAGLPEDMFGVI